MRTALLLAALQGVTPAQADPPADTTRLQPDSAAMATAYSDEATRELVRLARGRRGMLDASIFHYQALARQRISIGIQALRRDRVLYRRESVGTIEWWRDRPGRITMHGAREALPAALSGLRVPDNLGDFALLPRPDGDRLWVPDDDDGLVWHPLVEGGEALYRYAIGDTIAIRLPDGRELRLVELRVTPRERDFSVISGSFWIELENHAVVQAVFRPAREFDLKRDLGMFDPGSEDDLGVIPELMKPVRFDVRYLTVEYGLWEKRWWMPRLMAFEGYIAMGPARVPVTMEVAYSDYTVEADRHGLPELPPLTLHLASDPYGKPRLYRPSMEVVLPEDTASLLHSDLFTESFFSEGESVMSETEVRELGRRLGALPPAPWQVPPPRITTPWTLGRGLMRYNRVEGFSVGVRADWDLSRLTLDLTARLGVADLMPRAELGVEVPGMERRWRVAGYHRLAAADPATRPFGLGNSLAGLLFGRDDGMYFQASGAEVRLFPEFGSGAYGIRVYGERQQRVDRETDLSVAELVGGGGFRPNIAADRASQVGVHAQLGLERGLDPVGFRWGTRLDLSAETGSFSFVRPGVTVRAGAPLPGSAVAAVELAVGTTLSADTGAAAVPIQSLWFLGGPGTLRGFAGGEIRGRDYFRGRMEVANQFPAARATLFTDAGWAGRFDDWHPADLAVAAGVGASFFDGLIRLDLARAIQPVQRWRLDLYFDALL